MKNALQVFSYNGARVRSVERDGVVWFVAKDVCDILELGNVTNAIRSLDDDEKMTLTNNKGHSGKRGGAQSLNVVNEPGLYALIFKSNKPEAKAFARWVRHTLLPHVMHTGSYSVKMTAEDRELKLKELDMKDRELDLLAAQILKDVLHNPPFPLTDETRTVFGHEVFRLATNKEYLAMLPESTEKWYTATEIGSILGISANRVGRIAKTLGIKAPEGKSNEYGRWIFSKSRNSNREVPSYIYSEAGLELFKEYQNGELLEIA